MLIDDKYNIVYIYILYFLLIILIDVDMVFYDYVCITYCGWEKSYNSW